MSRFGPLETRQDVWINDLPFSHVDDLGNRWIISDIDGWWDVPSPTMGDVDRAYSEDGTYYEPGRFESRAIRVQGKIIPPNTNSNAGNIARKELNKRLQMVRRTGLLRVLESPELGGGKQSEVVIVARPLVSSNQINGTLDFDIQFRAPDPRKYSTTLNVIEAFLGGGATEGRSYDLIYNRKYNGGQDKSTASVLNEGDYNTYGTVRLHGPVDNPGFSNLTDGRFIKFTGVRLGINEYLDVNLLEKTVLTESGVSLRDRMDPGSRWFKFEEGTTKVSFSGNQYIEPVPGMPDVRNLVTNPSYQDLSAETETITARQNIAPNPSGYASETRELIREMMFNDPQAEQISSFSAGSLVNGKFARATVNLLPPSGESEFPAYYLSSRYYVQMDLKPTNNSVTTASLSAGSSNSGPIAISTSSWTTVRLDGFSTSGDFAISLNMPGASTTNLVSVKNIMVLRSITPISGPIPFWTPEVGINSQGVEVSDLGDGLFREGTSRPDFWTLPSNPGSSLRLIGDLGVHIIPETTGDHVVDFGAATQAGRDISYGVSGQNIKEIRLYNDDTGQLLDVTAPASVMSRYVSESAIVPRVEATVSVGSIPPRIDAVTISYDGPGVVFTERTTNYNGYIYAPGTDSSPALEQIDSFVNASFPEGFHRNARITSQYSAEGTRALAVTYPKVTEGSEYTPVTDPTSTVPGGMLYARARVMGSKPTTVTFRVEGTSIPGQEFSVSTNPNYWAPVAFPFEVVNGDTPYLSITPSPEDTDVVLYLDSMGIMTEDYQYFDGSTTGSNYVWTGTPHGSVSATIPVAGIPRAKMEIMYRNAWIG